MHISLQIYVGDIGWLYRSVQIMKFITVLWIIVKVDIVCHSNFRLILRFLP